MAKRGRPRGSKNKKKTSKGKKGKVKYTPYKSGSGGSVKVI